MAKATGDSRTAGEPHVVELDPVTELYKRDVDRSLIREQLRRTVDERVRRMISALRLATELGAAGRRAGEPR